MTRTLLTHLAAAVVAAAIAAVLVAASAAIGAGAPDRYTPYGKSVLKGLYCPEDAYRFVPATRPNPEFNATDPAVALCVPRDGGKVIRAYTR